MCGSAAAADILSRLRTNYDSTKGARAEVSRRRTAGSDGCLMKIADNFMLHAM